VRFIRWTKAVLVIAVKVLNQSDTVREAADTLSMKFERNVSPSMLRKALRNAGLGRASDHTASAISMQDVLAKEDAVLPMPDVGTVTPNPETRSILDIDEPDLGSFDPSMVESLPPGPPEPSPDLPIHDLSKMYRVPFDISGEAKWLIFSDTHCAHEDRESFDQMLNSDFASICDGVIFAGDGVDNEQMSKHGRSHDRPLREDYARFAEMISDVCDACPIAKQVRIVAGNHDNWIIEYQKRGVRSDAFFLLQDQMGNQILEMLGRLALDVGDDRLMYSFGTNNWWTRHGDMIVAHPKRFLGPTQVGRGGRTAFAVYKWFQKRYPGIRTFAIGHTHRLHFEVGTPSFKREQVLLVETGCMQGEADYTHDGRSTHDPFHVGWAEIVQVDGVTDFTRSRVVQLKTV